MNGDNVWSGISEDIYDPDAYVFTGGLPASGKTLYFTSPAGLSPIIDQYVLNNLGLSIVGSGKVDRCRNAIDVYYRICDWYDDYLETQEAKSNREGRCSAVLC